MSQVLRPLAASGVVLTTAGMIAVTPVAVTQVPDIQSRLVTLTAGGVSDLPSGFGDLFSNTQTNATDLFNHFSFAPFPALQQAIANQIGNIEGVFSDPSSIANIPGDIASNAEAAFKAPFGPFIPVAGSSSDVYSSLDPAPGTAALTITIPNILDPSEPITHTFHAALPSHEQLFNLLTADPSLLNDLLPGSNLGTDLNSLLDFSASPFSGVLWGTVGTFASPFLQLDADFTQLEHAFSGGGANAGSAFTDLLNDPANILDAFLNGYGPVDLSPATNTSDLLNTFFPGLESFLNGLGVDVSANLSPTLTFGGLLSGGGSLFDALGLDAGVTAAALGSTVSGSADIPGVSVGPIGSLIETGQAIAQAIGWDGTGNPLESAFGGLTGGGTGTGGPDDLLGDLSNLLNSIGLGDLLGGSGSGGLGGLFSDLTVGLGGSTAAVDPLTDLAGLI